MKFMKFKDIKIDRIGNDTTLIGGIWANEDEGYIMYLPEFGIPKGKTLFAIEATTEDWEKLLLQSDVVETQVLAKMEDGKLYKAVVRKCQRAIDQQVSWNVFRRDGYACRYCGRDNVPLTVDHLVLWEEGGPSTEENLLAACKKCNKTRGNMQYADWLNHPRYRKVAEALTQEQRQTNLDGAATLSDIDLVITVRKKR